MRARARLLVGRLALFVFVLGLALPNFASSHLLAEADPDCGAFPTTDHARPGIEAVKAPAEHCALCHLLRSLSETAPASTESLVVTFVVDGRCSIGAINPAGYCPQFNRPSRAPPTTSAL